jgi:hypothetical protein
MAKHLVILGNSQSGKDTLAKAIERLGYWQNRKFSKFAKDFVDSIYGGNFESDRYQDLGGFTKDDLLVELYHVLKDKAASVEYARRNWYLDYRQNYLYTDVRTLTEAEFLVDNYYPLKVVVLPGGTPKSSDQQLPEILGYLKSQVPIINWEYNHPASYNKEELKLIATNLIKDVYNG